MSKPDKNGTSTEDSAQETRGFPRTPRALVIHLLQAIGVGVLCALILGGILGLILAFVLASLVENLWLTFGITIAVTGVAAFVTFLLSPLFPAKPKEDAPAEPEAAPIVIQDLGTQDCPFCGETVALRLMTTQSLTPGEMVPFTCGSCGKRGKVKYTTD